MKKTNLVILALLLSLSVYVSAQEVQKPSKEDFFHTWVTERIDGKTKYSIEISFIDEAAYTHKTTLLLKTTQNFIISKWEEATNTFDNTEEFPYGFKIYSKESKNRAESIFYMFINKDKTKFLSLINFGDYKQYDIFIKK